LKYCKDEFNLQNFDEVIVVDAFIGGPVKPNLSPQQWTNYKRTKFQKDLLEARAGHCSQTERSVREQWPAIVDFLNEQKKPVVIAAHCGCQ